MDSATKLDTQAPPYLPKAIMLSVPSAGSSWLGETLAAANKLKLGFELLNPQFRKNCSVELTFGGGDESVYSGNICRPGRYLYASATRIENAMRGLPVFDKEVYCFHRIAELRHHAELCVLYRPPHMTFPFNRAATYKWYRAIWYSYLANQGLYRPPFAAALEKLRAIAESDHQIATAVHFLSNQAMLRAAEIYRVPVISYETIMTCLEADLCALLAQWLPPQLLPAPSAAKICATRKVISRVDAASFFVYDQVAAVLENEGIYVSPPPTCGDVFNPRRA